MSADNTSPTVNQGTGGSSAWKVDGTGGTFPISGSVTVTNGAGASAVNIQDGGNSITVDGSVTVTQSTASNLKVDLSGTAANSTAILVTGTGGTFPVSGSVTVSGTVTANAGTNLNTSALQLDTTGAALNLAQGSTTSGQTGPLLQGAVTTSAPTYTTAKTNPLSLTTGGLLRVDGTGGSFPVSGTVAATQSTSPWVDNITQLNSNTIDTNSGSKSNGTLRVVVATDQPALTNSLNVAPQKASITAAGGSFASSGNNTVITPSNSLHLSYISLNAAAANTAAVICIVKFTTGGSTLYEVQLLPGAIWAHNIGGGTNYVTGTSGQALVVNLDSAQTVYYSIEYADV